MYISNTALNRHVADIAKIYSNRTQSETRRNHQLPPTEPQVSSPPIVGLQKVAPVKQVQQIPDIAPMRRGRPTAPVQQPPPPTAAAARPSPSPMRGTVSDPFAALDSQDVQVRRAAADELAARFPSLDEFSLLHDRGQKFEFDQTPATADPLLTKRVTEALADDAFALAPTTKVESAPTAKPSVGVSRSASVKQSKPYESPRTSNSSLKESTPQRTGMVSSGVQTSPAPSPAPPAQKYPDISNRPLWRVPTPSHHQRTMSQPRTTDQSQGSPSLGSEFAPPTLPTRPSLDLRSRSHMSTLNIPKSPASSRPSLESQRPSALDLGNAIDRSRSANSNARPVSMHVESNLDYLRDREMASGRNFDAPSLQRRITSSAIDDSEPEIEDKNIRSSVDFLRVMERDDTGQKHKHRRSSSQSKHAKRGSIASLTSNTKNIVKGRFGDAFRRFETNNSSRSPEHERDQPPFSSPQNSRENPTSLTPIAGSEATGGLSDDDRSALDESQELSPELRRELERRQLSEEERRVEAAAAEYKQRITSQGQGQPKAGPSKASTIQNRVKNLLDESSKPAPVSRTAEGYGKYTDTGKPLPLRPQDQTGTRQAPTVARKPLSVGAGISQPPPDLQYAKPVRPPVSSSSAPPAISPRLPSGPAPRAPPKPKSLRTGGLGDAPLSANTSPTKPSPIMQEKALPGIRGGDGAGNDWDVETFSKRYPSLSGLEMVETEIPRRSVRDV